MKNKTNHNKILNLKKFKSIYCPDHDKPHDYKQCFYYHSEKDMRRTNVDYYKNICRFYIKNKNTNEICPYKTDCKFCHNNFELHYHPLNYKKKFCKEMDDCTNKEFCSFAHNYKEINIDLIHLYKFDWFFFLFKFKTEFCPIPISSKHDKKSCIYAHNYQDYKRPFSPYLINEECKSWKKKKYKEYNEQCKNGTHCNRMHGWKEIYFNPDNNQNHTEDLVFNIFKKLFKIYNNQKKDLELLEFFKYTSPNQNKFKIFINS